MRSLELGSHLLELLLELLGHFFFCFRGKTKRSSKLGLGFSHGEVNWRRKRRNDSDLSRKAWLSITVQISLRGWGWVTGYTWVFEQRCEINSNVSEIPTNCQRFMYVYNSLLNTTFLLCPYGLLISPSCPRGPHPV